jgi:hypothetical protein
LGDLFLFFSLELDATLLAQSLKSLAGTVAELVAVLDLSVRLLFDDFAI